MFSRFPIFCSLLLTVCLIFLCFCSENSLAQQPATAPKRTIYIPYKNLKTIIDKKNATVVMPYQEYQKLLKRAGDTKKTERAPGAVITKASYISQVEKDQAATTVKYQVKVMGDPWVALPVQFGEAAIGEVSSQGPGEFLLQGRGSGDYIFLFSKPGEYEITLQLTSKVHTSPEGRDFHLQCPSSGITTLELSVPQADQTVQLTPQPVLVPTKEAPDNQKTTIKATLGSTNKITARWFPRASSKPDMDLLTSVTNRHRISIADGMLHTTAELTYQVLRGELEQLQIAVPLGHRILDVTAPSTRVKSWKTTTEEKRQLITIQFLGNLKNKFNVNIHTEVSAPSGSFQVSGISSSGEVHGIHSIGAVHENGELEITHGAGITLAVDEKQGVIRMAQPKQPASGKSKQAAAALHYKYFSPQFILKISSRPVKPWLNVQQNGHLIFREDELSLQSSFAYTVERAGVFELKFKIPKELELDSIQADSRQEQSFDKATRILTVTFPEQRLGALQVSFKAHRSLQAGDIQDEFELPVIEPLDTARETGTIYIYAPASIEVVTNEERLTGAYASSHDQYLRLPNTRLVSAWEYNRRPVAIYVRTLRKPTRVSAQVGTTFDIQQESVHVTSYVEYQVAYAGLDTFRIEVPEAIAGSASIRVEDGKGLSVPIKQKELDEAPFEGFWGMTITTQRPVLGRQRFRVDYDLSAELLAGKKEESEEPADEQPEKKEQPLENSQINDTTEEMKSESSLYQALLQPLRVLPLEDEETGEIDIPITRLTGEVALLKNRALSLTADKQGDDIELIDIRELRLIPSSGTLAFRYYKQPAAVKLTVEKFDVKEVVQTVISRVLTEVVVSRDPQSTFRCRFKLTTSERQRLKIQLPLNAEPLGVFVDQKQVSLEKDTFGQTGENRDSYYMNVARTKKSDQPFFLTIQFLWRVNPAAFQSYSQPLNVPLPQIDGQQNKVAVQEQRVVLWIPDKFSLVGQPDNFQRPSTPRLSQILSGYQAQYSPDYLNSWIGTTGSNRLDFPTAGMHAYEYRTLGHADEIEVIWCHLPYLTWVVSGALLLLAFVLITLNWEKKLLLLLLIAFGFTLYAVRDSDWAVHIFASALYGLVALVAIWLIHALFRSTQKSTIPSRSQPIAVTAQLSDIAVVPPPGVFDMLKPSSSSKQEDAS